MKQRLNYVTRVDVEDTSAQSIQISSMCAAFYIYGVDIKLYCPGKKRFPYHVPVFLFGEGLILNISLLLVCCSRFFFASRRLNFFYSRDILCCFGLSMLGFKVSYEMHQPMKSLPATTLLKICLRLPNFKVITITQSLKDFITSEYTLNSEILVAHDGVEHTFHSSHSERELSKRRDCLRNNFCKVILHTGSLYKGAAEVLLKIAISLPEYMVVGIGGSVSECERFNSRWKHVINLKFFPNKPHQRISKWQQSSDFLVYVNTRANANYWCTSSLKLFEYLTSGVPVISVSEGSVHEILFEGAAIECHPDQINSLRKLIFVTRLDPLATRNFYLKNYNWTERAKRIVKFIST